MVNKIKTFGKLANHIIHSDCYSYCIFFVTSQCNASCDMCFNWQSIKNHDVKPELSLDEIKEICKSLPKLFQIILSGGEPFLRKDLVEIVKSLISFTKPAVLSIPTNGFLTNRIIETVRQISDNHPTLILRINVSVDGIKKQHDDIRNVKGIYVKVVETIKQLKKIQHEYPLLSINVNTVLINKNCNNIIEIVDNIEKEFQPDVSGIGFPRGNLRDTETSNFNFDIYKDVQQYIQKKLLQNNTNNYPFHHFAPVLIKLISKTIINEINGYSWPMPCVAFKKMIVISEQGVVSPCEMLEYLRNKVGTKANKELQSGTYGNLRDSNLDIQTLLNSERARGIKKFIKDGKCHCTFECAIYASLLFNIKVYPSIFSKVMKNWFCSVFMSRSSDIGSKW